MSWPIAQNSAVAEERSFDFKLRDATDKITPENVTPSTIVLTAYYADGTSDTLSTSATAIDAAKGLYRGSFTQAESDFPGNATVVATCTGCDPEPIPVTILPSVFAASATPAEIAAAHFSRAFDATKMAGYTFEQILGLMASVLLGKASGLNTTTATYRNPGDTANAVVATVDADGNRTAVTRTTSAVA